MSGFLNLSAGIIAAALAVPALLLLYFLKLRRKQAPISSTLLWRKAIEDMQVNAPLQRLRKNLLLFLQLILLLLLCLALARPIARGSAGPGQWSVILIDHSASMNASQNGQTRLDQAKQRAKSLIDSMPAGGRAMVIAFASSARVVEPLTSDKSALRSAIERIGPTDQSTRFKTAYALANAQKRQVKKKSAEPEVWLFSDGRALDADDAALHLPMHFERIGNDQDNVGIVAMSARRDYEDPTKLQVFVRLENFGTKPVNPDVQLSIAAISQTSAKLSWQVVRVASASVLPESWTPDQLARAEKDHGIQSRSSLEFELPLTTGAAVRVQQMHADALPADDTAQLIVPPPRVLHVLLVTNGNFFLEKVLQSLALRDRQVITPGDYQKSWSDPKTNPSQYDVIIFDSFVPKRLPPSGNFIWFAAVPPGLDVTAAKKGNAFAEIPDPRFLDWQVDHPILRDLSLRDVLLRDTLKLSVNRSADVLAQGLRSPLIVLDRKNNQTHLVVGFDLWQSDWPEHVSFPIFMRNALQFMALGSQMGVRQSYRPGDSPKISHQQLARLGDAKQLVLTGPDTRQTIKIGATGDVALPPLRDVGLYTLTPPVPQMSHLAVNLLDANESNLSPVVLAQPKINRSVAATANAAAHDLWRWLIAFIAVPLLLIEWWVYTRRVHM